MNMVEKIHAEFRNSVMEYDSVLFAQLSKIESQLNAIPANADPSYSRTVSEMFKTSKSVRVIETVKQKFQNLSQNKKEVKALVDELQEIHVKYPYKIIHYSQMINLLEKYNLYVGPTEQYKEHLPPSNAQEVSNFVNGPKVIERWGMTKGIPLCAQMFREHEQYRHYGKSEDQRLYICAPINYFNIKDLAKVGRELYVESDFPEFKMLETPNMPVPPDPIVLAPIAMRSELGKRLRPFFIVSAWGPEAKDAEVQNPKMN